MSERWYLLESGATGSAENMAWDEALLKSAPLLGRPVARLYGWKEPAATFGYFQRIAEVKQMTELRPLIRRPTGGGLVPHDADWTYSLIFPCSHEWYSLKAIESYRRVHGWIQFAFSRVRVMTELATHRVEQTPGQCFVGAEPFDLLWQQRKIAGAAQRRTRDGLLIQGSIQPPTTVTRENFKQAFCEAATESWRVTWEPLPVDEALTGHVKQLTEKKYSRAEYNERR
jgi:lipoate-protein ligase A